MKRLLFLLSTAVALLVFVGAASAVGTKTTPRGEDGIFLCYSAYQVDPGVWRLSQASGLVKDGYWQPYAVLGNTVGGTNVGAYHLVCNLLAGQSVPTIHGYVGDGGNVLGSDVHDQYASVLGLYPLVK